MNIRKVCLWGFYAGCFFINIKTANSQSVRLLSSFSLPAEYKVNGVRLGGLSGIDYDVKDNVYYLVTDDRSEIDKARYYQARIVIKHQKIDTVKFLKDVYLLDQYHQPYKKDESDFESIRLLPNRKELIIGDEGGRNGRAGIHIYNMSGSLVKDIEIDPGFITQTRFNKSFESISLLRKKDCFVFATEVPLFSDGQESDYQNQGMIRIIAKNYKTGRELYQSSYYLDKLKPEHHNKFNEAAVGLAEILVIKKDLLLTLERTGIETGDNFQYDFDCRMFLVRIKKRKNGLQYYSEKKEVFNFSSVADGRKNFEGICFGPLINGQKTIMIVSDNNFSTEPSTFYLLGLDLEK